MNPEGLVEYWRETGCQTQAGVRFTREETIGNAPELLLWAMVELLRPGRVMVDGAVAVQP